MICMCADVACQMYGCRRAREVPAPNFIGHAQPITEKRGATPHKCPVCEGTGIIATAFFDGTLAAGLPTNKSCHACINGIIWG